MNTDVFQLLILTVLNSHCSLKAKSCESVYSVLLARMRNKPEELLSTVRRMRSSGAPGLQRVAPNRGAGSPRVADICR